ncbi:MAG: hypothetical protein ACI9O4_000301 [Chitinophagales bacterium]|jgi:hypothetical protein
MFDLSIDHLKRNNMNLFKKSNKIVEGKKEALNEKHLTKICGGGNPILFHTGDGSGSIKIKLKG